MKLFILSCFPLIAFAFCCVVLLLHGHNSFWHQSCMLVLQVHSWSWLLSMQRNVYNRQIIHENGLARILLLVLMLCLAFKFDGHAINFFWRLLQASRIGVVFLLFRVQLIAHKSTFKNLKELLLRNILYKSKVYSVQLQAMVDREKWFQDVFVGLLGSMNDYKVLQLSNLYKNATFDG